MRARLIALLAPLVLLGAGCKEREAPRAAATAPPPAIDAAGAPSAAGGADAAAAAPTGDDPLAEKLRHCPLTVDGARTELRDVAGGIEVVVTADDPTATAEIRRRAAHLVAFSLGAATKANHGNGEGGGFMRDCPVVTRGTEITSTAVPGGASLIVRPADRTPVADLRAETRRRHDALQAR
ncbi:MAG TPA: hypothetical protein VM734_32585 [Kofleriaceae bacterium]|nr:hypothetical protein [Kofleriaceae bacterium]